MTSSGRPNEGIICRWAEPPVCEPGDSLHQWGGSAWSLFAGLRGFSGSGLARGVLRYLLWWPWSLWLGTCQVLE
jgi:hypothetical protein